jgi:hypothetical protein
MKRLLSLLLLAFSFSTSSVSATAAATAMPIKPGAIAALQKLAARDNFVAQRRGLYTGVHDRRQRKEMNAKFGIAVGEVISAIERKATKAGYLAIFRARIEGFDRESLDTDDTERVASNFEQIMDCIGLDSSEGILNTWLYGFDPG